MDNVSVRAHSLHRILNSCTEEQTRPISTPTESKPAIEPYRQFSKRLGHLTGNGLWRQQHIETNAMLDKDPAIQAYYAVCKGKRGNNGILNKRTQEYAHVSIKQFMAYTDISLTNHAVSDLVNYKRKNPLSTDIEQALRAYSTEWPIKTHASYASCILGIFKANFARLDLRVNNHFEPAIENCKLQTFFQIYDGLTSEQRDMVQWGTYYPERATAAYRIPLSDFTKTVDYSIGYTESHHQEYSNKTKVRHPIIIPLGFFDQVEARSRAAGRTQPFPNHQSEWKKITAFAKSEYNVRLVANYVRKMYERMASRAKLNPAIAAFMMGDKTKLAATGHLPLIYNTDLRDIDEILKEYERSDILDYLNLANKGEPQATTSELQGALKRIRELEEALARRG